MRTLSTKVIVSVSENWRRPRLPPPKKPPPPPPRPPPKPPRPPLPKPPPPSGGRGGAPPAPSEGGPGGGPFARSEEHTSELQSRRDLVCRLLLEKKNNKHHTDEHE